MIKHTSSSVVTFYAFRLFMQLFFCLRQLICTGTKQCHILLKHPADMGQILGFWQYLLVIWLSFGLCYLLGELPCSLARYSAKGWLLSVIFYFLLKTFIIAIILCWEQPSQTVAGSNPLPPELLAANWANPC